MADSAFLKCKDHTLSGKEFELHYDEEREMLITFPKPGLEELPEFYKSEKYISHTDSAQSFLDKCYQGVKQVMIRRKLNWIKNRTPEGTLLDIGAGTGDFLVGAKKYWEVQGIEPNADARILAKNKGIQLYENSAGLASNSFDVITMWHVLEHVPDLEKQVEELSRLLKKGGLLVIAVPNFRSYDAKKYKQFWAAFDVPRHLWHFSSTSIEKIFSGHFNIIQTKGLFFDAFYVSLLSEEYKNESSNIFKGLWTGLVSNLKAQSTKEYSSKVYFLQKR